METKLIVKYIAIVLIIAAFGGIIYGITKMFQSTCPTGSTYNKEQKKCIKDCVSGTQYDSHYMKCIPICDPGTNYFPGHDDQCYACKPGCNRCSQ